MYAASLATAEPLTTTPLTRRPQGDFSAACTPVSYTHLRAHETVLDLVCRLLLEKTTTPNIYTT